MNTWKELLPMTNSQKGSALIISLILMFVLTILALSSASNTILQTKMSTTIADRNLALQSAEFAARIAEEQLQKWINTQNKIISNNSTLKETKIGVYIHDPVKATQPWELNTAKWDSTDSIDAGSIANSKTIKNPRWMLAVYPDNTNAQAASLEGVEQGALPEMVGRRYTITAVGWGSNATTHSKIQIEYYSPF